MCADQGLKGVESPSYILGMNFESSDSMGYRGSFHFAFFLVRLVGTFVPGFDIVPVWPVTGWPMFASNSLRPHSTACRMIVDRFASDNGMLFFFACSFMRRVTNSILLNSLFGILKAIWGMTSVSIITSFQLGSVILTIVRQT